MPCESSAAHPSRSHPRDSGGLANLRATVGGQSFPVWRVDDLFFGGAWTAERLAFAHWDVEGNEAAVVAGAARTLERDRPLLTVEVVLFAQEQHHRGGWQVDAGGLLRSLSQRHDYAAFVVEESCGVRRPRYTLWRGPGGGTPAAPEAEGRSLVGARRNTGAGAREPAAAHPPSTSPSRCR